MAAAVTTLIERADAEIGDEQAMVGGFMHLGRRAGAFAAHQQDVVFMENEVLVGLGGLRGEQDQPRLFHP